eukprot:gnl/MRDRNA2_/MRDRNA2_15304_c0_seq1.p1 gnl/MRDRNA2_/MRDRNA2_15304_c0~~gnl/MRDRNA2_/MRDRNA2_15304_c0_seq1.p1  ORF type:complete len:129 (+),score=29.84 gnl/MRDRNA2_/MRDRNA2_15304_c0_seq1:117-503(+)
MGDACSSGCCREQPIAGAPKDAALAIRAINRSPATQPTRCDMPEAPTAVEESVTGSQSLRRGQTAADMQSFLQDECDFEKTVGVERSDFVTSKSGHVIGVTEAQELKDIEYKEKHEYVIDPTKVSLGN